MLSVDASLGLPMGGILFSCRSLAYSMHCTWRCTFGRVGEVLLLVEDIADFAFDFIKSAFLYAISVEVANKTFTLYFRYYLIER